MPQALVRLEGSRGYPVEDLTFVRACDSLVEERRERVRLVAGECRVRAEESREIGVVER
jgi:hypothetical protein